MGVSLTVNNNAYNYPTEGEEPGWGGDATGWAEDVTVMIESLAGTGTISETQALIEAVVASPTEIPGLIFNNTLVESAQITYRILRSTTIEQLSEAGILQVEYDPASSSWVMTRQIVSGSDTRVVLDIDTNGQGTYTALSLSGSSYSGYIKFKTITILKA